MPAYDTGFKIVAHTAGQALAQLAGESCPGWEPIVSEVQTTERLADRAFRARRDSHRFVVYMEAYTRWQASAPWSLLAKAGLLSERERLPTLSLLFILRPRGYRSQGGEFRLGIGAQPTQQLWYREICLWQQVPQRWWENEPGLMALYPLCRHGQSTRMAVQHAAGVIQAREPEGSRRADLLTTLAIFGKLVYPDLNVIELIGRRLMEESKFYLELQAEVQRRSILDALEVKFGQKAAAEAAALVERCEDSEQLREIHRFVVGSARFKQVRDRLRAL